MLHFASNTAFADMWSCGEMFLREGNTADHILLEQLFDHTHIQMTKTLVHEKCDFRVFQVIDFHWNFHSSVRGYIVKIV